MHVGPSSDFKIVDCRFGKEDQARNGAKKSEENEGEIQERFEESKEPRRGLGKGVEHEATKGSQDHQRKVSVQSIQQPGSPSKRNSANSSVHVASLSHLQSGDEPNSSKLGEGDETNQEHRGSDAGVHGNPIKIEDHDHPDYERQKSNNSEKDNPEPNEVVQGQNKEREVDIFAHLDDDEESKRLKNPFNIILENIFFTIVIALITIYSLFSEDIKILFTQKGADIVFNILNIIALVLFSVEIIFGFIGKPVYRWSFFFWLDIISTVSMLLDLTWISNEFNGGYSSSQNSLIPSASSF